MSGSLPSSPAPRSISIRALQPALVSIAHSGRAQRRSRGAHLWAIELGYPPMRRSEFDPMLAFLDQQQDEYGQFTVVLPRMSTARGALGGTPLVNNVAGYSIGASSVAVDGASLSVTNWVRAGDFFKFGGHAKVYRATADANSDGSGNVTLAFWPPLVSAVANNEAATLSDVTFTVRLAGPAPACEIEPGVFGALSLSLVEDA